MVRFSEALVSNGLTWCLNRQSMVASYEEEKR